MDWKKILKAAFIPVFILAFIQILISAVLANIYGGCIDCRMGLFSIFDLWVLVYTIGFFFLIGYYSTKRYKFEFSEIVLTGIFAVLFFLIAEIPMTMLIVANAFSFYSAPSADLIHSLYGALDEIAINAPTSLFNPTMCGTILFIALLVGAIVADMAKKSSATATRQPKDFRKIMGAAVVPAIAIALLAIIGTAVGLFVQRTTSEWYYGVGSIYWMVGMSIFVMQCLAILWAGYRAVKKYQLDLVSATLASTISAVIASAIQAIVLYVVIAVSGERNWRLYGSPVDILGSLLITFITLMVPWAMIGAALGLIGGFIAQKTMQEKPTKKPSQS